MNTFFHFDSEGGSIGRWHWINSDTSTPPGRWCGEIDPQRFWGQTYFDKPTKLLEFYD